MNKLDFFLNKFSNDDLIQATSYLGNKESFFQKIKSSGGFILSAVFIIYALTTNFFSAPNPPELLIDVTTSSTMPADEEVFIYKFRYRYSSTTEHGTNAQVQFTFPNAYEVVSTAMIGGSVSTVNNSGNQYTVSLESPSSLGLPAGTLAAGSSGIFEFQVKIKCGTNGVGDVPVAGTTVNLTQNPVFTVSGISNTALAPASVTVPVVNSCSPPPTTSGSSIFEKRNDMNDFIGTDMLFRYFLDIPAHGSSYVFTDDFPDEFKLVAGMSTQQSGWFSSNFATIEVQATNGSWYDISAYNSIYDWIHTVAEGATLVDGSSNPIPGTSRVDVDVPNSNYTPPNPDVPFTADYAEGIVAIRLTTVSGGIATNGSYAMHMYIPPSTPTGDYQNCFTTTDPNYPTPDCDEIYVTDLGSLEIQCRWWSAPYQLGSTLIPSFLSSNYPYLEKDPLDFQFTHRVEPRSKSSKVENITMETLVDPAFDFIETGSIPNYWVVHAPELYTVNDSSALVPIFTRIPNYNGTGRVLLRWEFPNLIFPTNQEYEKDTGPYELSSDLIIYYSTRYTQNIPLGATVVTNSYLKTGTVMARYTSGAPTQNDECDLTLSLPTTGGTMESEKYVKGGLDTEQSQYPSFGNTDLSGSATYELYIHNKNFENVKQIDVADILPYIGDREMLGTTNRGSGWSEVLASAITVERYKIGTGLVNAGSNIPNGVLYANTYNACYLDAALPSGQVTADMTNANTGQSAGCTDFSSTTPVIGAKGFAFRWLNTGDPLVFGEYLKITVDVQQLNGEADMTNNEVAWSSFAYTAVQADDDVLFSSEPLKVGVKMIDISNKATFCGTIWEDENGDGQRGGGEPLVSDATVYLYDASQNPITESVTIGGVTSNIHVTTLTDSTGHYCFYGLDPYTNYYVRLENESDYSSGQSLHNFSLTTPNATGSDNDDSDAAMGTLTGSSATPYPLIATSTNTAGSITDYYDFGFYKTVIVGNYVWFDDDASGDQDVDENPASGVTLTLKRWDHTIIETDITNANGLYLFEDAPPGEYYIEASTLPVGKIPTALHATGNDDNDSDFSDSPTIRTNNFFLLSGENIGDKDLGLIDNIINPASICGRTWDDFDADGVLDVGEPRQPRITIQLLDVDGFVLNTTESDENGDYCFNNLTPNITYQVAFILPSIISSSFTNAGADMDANSSTGVTGNYTPTNNQNITNVDAGFIGPFSIGNQVWNDVNRNGTFDVGEPSISNVKVFLLDGTTSNEIDSTITDGNGKYVFKNLLQNSYRVELELPSNLISTEDVGTSTSPNGIDHDDNGVTNLSASRVRSDLITLEAGGGSNTGANWSESDHGELINGDYDPASNPKAYYTMDFGLVFYPIEICDDGIDNDGDNQIDCYDADCSCEPCPGSMLTNSGFEDPGTATFGSTFQGCPAEPLPRNSTIIPNWSMDYSCVAPPAPCPNSYWIDDTADKVKNPEGDYFIWLAEDVYCARQNTISLTEGQCVQICASVAAFSDAGAQSSTTFQVETTNGVGSIFTQVVPISTSWTNMNWQEYCFTWTATETNTFDFYFSQKDDNGATIPDGMALDNICITTVTCEICNNGIDDDGDGLIDCNDPDCSGLTNSFPGFPIDFANNNCSWIDYFLGDDLSLIGNGDGTMTISGSIGNAIDADFDACVSTPCGTDDGWLVDMTLSDKMNWTTFQAGGGTASIHANCSGAETGLDYWDVSGTLTGTGCNAGRTIIITGPEAPYRMQIGYGGNSGDGTCSFGMSTWFAMNEGGTPMKADIYAFVNESCYVESVCSSGGDNDNDGINDICDLDDDNDGILDTDECPTPTSSGLTGPITTFTAHVSTTDANSNAVPHILDSITYGGSTYTDFIVPDTYTPGFSLTDNSGVSFVKEGAFLFNIGSNPNYNIDILPAFQSRNLNAYQDLDLNDFSNGDYFDLKYNNPIISTAGGFIAVTERGGNNPQIIQALDINGLVIGTPVNVSTSDYVDLGVRVDPVGSQDANLALYPIDALAPVGVEFYGIRISFGTASPANSDGPDAKAFLFGNTALFTCDYDGDGIPNDKDLDSDNDGCPDAIEGGGSFTTADLTNDRLTGAVGSDGIPTVVPSGQSIGDSQNETEQGICSTCHPSNPAFADNDSDGIGDDCDLDDDNDGILDVTETCLAVPVNFTGLTVKTPGSPSQTFTQDINGNPLSSNITVSAPYIVSGSPSNFSIDVSFVSSAEAIRFIDDVSANAGDAFGVQLTFDNPEKVYINADNSVSPSRLTDLDNFTFIPIGAVSSNFSWIVESYSNAVFYTSGDSITVEGTSTNTAGPFAEFVVFPSEPINGIEVIYENTGISNANSAVFNFSYCDEDTDNDGIVNSKDLDSDNDGCPDAIEGGGSFTTADLTNDRLTGAVGSDGVPTVVPSGQSIGDSQDETEQGICSTCHPSNSAFADNDSDGVGDDCDLDDDNDGILDTDEVCGNTTNIANTIGYGNHLVNGNTYSLLGTDVTYNISITSGNGNLQGYDAELNGAAIRLDYSGGGGDFEGSLTSTFSNDISSVVFKLTDFDGAETYQVDVYDENNTLYDLTTEGVVSVGSNITQTGNTFSTSVILNVDGNNPSSDPVGSVLFNFSGKVSRIVLTFIHPVSGAGSIRYIQPIFCSPEDTDNDGTPNHLDLDSDNDGCPDAIEGGANFTYANLQNDTLTGGIDVDGVPLVAAGGQGLGSSQDSLISGCTEICNNGIDDDGDGDFDYLDEDCGCQDSIPNLVRFDFSNPNIITGTGLNLGDQILYSNVGNLEGQSFDILATVANLENLTTLEEHGLSAGSDDSVVKLPSVGYGANVKHSATIQYDLLESGTSIPLSGSFEIEISDVDSIHSPQGRVEMLSIPQSQAEYYNLFIPTNLRTSFENGNITITGTEEQVETDPEGAVKFLFENKNNFTITYGMKEGNGSTATGIAGFKLDGSNFSVLGSCVEVCNNGIDDDEDGLTDCEDPDCSFITTISPDETICIGTNTVLSASGGDTYLWSNSETDSIILINNLTSTTQYFVTITNATGCTNVESVIVTIENCPEVCFNGIDDDGDGDIDENDTDCEIDCRGVVALDFATAKAEGAGASGIPTLNYTPPAGNDRYLIFMASLERDHLPLAKGDNWGNDTYSYPVISFGGVNLRGFSSQKFHIGSNSFNRDFAEMSIENYFYFLPESSIPASGTFTIVSGLETPLSIGDEMIFSVGVFANVDTIESHYTNTGSTSISMDMTTINGQTPGSLESDNMLLAFTTLMTNSSVAPGTGWSEIGENILINADGNFATDPDRSVSVRSENDGLSQHWQVLTNVSGTQTATYTYTGGANPANRRIKGIRLVSTGCPEICDNGIDDDLDGLADCDDPDCYLVANSGDSDNDSDGIGDYCDLDDDNDGILDDIECSEIINTTLSWSAITNTVNGSTPDENDLNIGDVFYASGAYIDPSMGTSYGVVFKVESGNFASTRNTFNLSTGKITLTDTPDGLVKPYVEYSLSLVIEGSVTVGAPAGTPVTFDGFIFVIKDIDSADGLGNHEWTDVGAFSGTLPYKVIKGNDITSIPTLSADYAGVNVFGIYPIPASDTSTDDDPDHYLTGYYNASATKVTAIHGVYGEDSNNDGNSNASVSRGAFFELRVINCRDTDNDGITDYLDLDSDGDGCPDALEGGGSFTNIDLVNSGLPGGNSGSGYTGSSSTSVDENLGAIVDTDGVPTIASGGQDIGDSQNGLVSSCTEICNNGIDDDGDGDVDLADSDCACSATLQTPIWVVDEDSDPGNLHLWSYVDYTNPNSGVDYGRLQYFDLSTSTIRDAGDARDMEAMAVNTYTGVAYFLSTTRTNNGPSNTQALFKYDLNTAHANQGNIVLTLVGHITRPNNIAMEALAFDPVNNRFYSADPIDSNQGSSNSTDDLYYIDLSSLNVNPLVASNAILIGPISGLGETNEYVDGLEIDDSGNVYVIDGTDDHLYQIDPATGTIIAIIDNDLAGGTGHGSIDIETICWDAATQKMLGIDNSNEEFVEFDISQNGNNSVLMDYSATPGIPSSADFEGSALFDACLPKMSIGNLVFIDADDNGVYSSGEGIDGVKVELYQSTANISNATPLETIVTSGGGFYLFENLLAGDYFIHIPSSEFEVGGLLQYYISTSGSGGDNGIDDNDDGVDVANPSITGVSSIIVNLNENSEPINGSAETGVGNTDDDSDDDNGDMTIDFAFILSDEICNDGIDNDGDGLVDCEDPDCYLAANSGDSDNDVDGIGDSCDLDDDNDGIPDIDESSLDNICSPIGGSEFPSYDYSNCNSVSGGILFSNIGIFEGTSIDMFLADIPGVSVDCGSSGTLGCSIGDDGFTIRSTDPGDQLDIIFYENGTSTPIEINWAVYFDDFDDEEGISVESAQLLSYILNSANGTTITTNGSYTNFDSGDNIQDDLLLLFKNVDSLSIEFTHDTDNRGMCFTSVSGAIPNNPNCNLVQIIGDDTDGDGIFNHLDLDSDNDGIFDVDEAGHSEVDANDDGIIDGANSLFGTNGLFDVLETSSDNGTLNYIIADSENSPDGIYDAIELDSDGDGCFDAQEAGVSDSENDGIAGTGTPIVDGNGLVTTIIYSTPLNNNWQNPLKGFCLPEICNDGIDNDADGFADCADCEDCYASTNCDDNDNDGVNDFCDLDDDNDGIPDVQDGCDDYTFTNLSAVSFNSTNISLTLNTDTDYVGLSGSGPGTNPPPSGVAEFITGYDRISGLDPVDFDFTAPIVYEVPNTKTVSFTLQYFNNITLHTDLNSYTYGDKHIKDYTLNTNIGNFIGSYTFNTTELTALDNGEWIEFTVHFQLPNTAVIGSSINLTGIDFIIETILGGFVDPFDPDQSEVFGVALLGVGSCIDCDGDGVSNHQDLDSDNDGIYDVVEAGHNQSHTNGQITSSVGTNGLADIVETTADSDVINYTISNSETSPDGTYDVCELDSDGDGCYDVLEENIDDPDGDGIAGTGVPTVDANGLVTSITYASPPNNTWQNPLIGPCLSEICDDGIDNDADGNADCDDSDCIPIANSATLNTCDNSNMTGSGVFILHDANPTVSTESGVIISYHLTLSDAQNGINNLISPYTSTDGTVHVRVERVSTGCYNTALITLDVGPKCVESCNNGIDDDGDGLIDCDDSDCPCCKAYAPDLNDLNKK